MSVFILILLNVDLTLFVTAVLPSFLACVTPFSPHIFPSASPSLSVFLCLHHVKHRPCISLNMPVFNSPIFSISASKHLPSPPSHVCAVLYVASPLLLFSVSSSDSLLLASHSLVLFYFMPAFMWFVVAS